MKILYHHRTASRDGQDVHIEEMVAAMRRQGHEVLVVAPGGAKGASFGHDGGVVARIKRLLPRVLYEVLELAYSVPAFFRLERACAAFGPDVLYERYNLFFLAGLWMKRWADIPYLLEVNSPLAHERDRHGGLALKALAGWSERAVWCGADMTFPVTEVLADFLRAAGVAERRIRVVPNGIDRQRFPLDGNGTAIRAELGLTGKVVLGFVGFVRDWHRLPDVLTAMAALENPASLHFLIAGEGPGLAAVIDQAARLGMADCVTCIGLVGRDRVSDYVAAFDIALNPRVEPYASPLKLFEYMGLGRAIIAPDQPNIREILTDGDNALLFRPDDPAHFRERIAQLCSDEALRGRLGRSATRTIDDKGYTWDDNVRRVLAGVGPSNRAP
ncbi:glycosyltransferase family 4 protein [Magnetospirillum moscoviense]|uniref:Glycosyltransferase WbuB n=1 Tax=Magnetospirillum moscoviense TaxID=1437059 RepID=A0A178MTH4_9PROT|nr:glycosyltransferase family 4 protein [Magnetospirillum moscoviense]OAN51564.1 glycosyltransferase WbuB [Magnetospirillum moscoviense]